MVEHRATGGHVYEERVVPFDAADEAAALELPERRWAADAADVSERRPRYDDAVTT